VLEPLQLLAAKTGQAEVHMHGSPAGRLAVMLEARAPHAGSRMPALEALPLELQLKLAGVTEA
jgi:hypothetical protein